MKKDKKIIKNLIISFLVIGISLLFSLLLFISPVNEKLQNLIWDSFFRLSPQKKNLTKNVGIIAIDDLTLFEAQKRGILWPFPRNIYALVADFLVKNGAKGVVFDIIFSSPDIDRADSYGEENDRAFYSVLEENKNIILAFNIDKRKIYDFVFDPLSIKNINKFKNIPQYGSILPIFELFKEGTNNFGYVDIETETDGIIRKYKPVVQIGSNYYPSLAIATYVALDSDELPSNLRFDKNGNFILKWYGEGGIDVDDNGNLIRPSTFDYFSFYHILANAIADRRGESLTIDKKLIKDRVFFIGASARGLLDLKGTPFTIKGKAYPGVEIHATAYLNILHRDWIVKFNFILELIIYSLILLIIIYFGIISKSYLKYSSIFVIILLFILAFHFVLFQNFNIMSHSAYFIIYLIISFVFTLGVNYILIGKNRNMIKQAFGTYLSPDLVRKITESENQVSLKGENVDASAFFIDIQGFTTFSEKNDPEKVVDVLNEYLKAFSDIIINNKGFVNKFLGDGLMALFGVPTYYEDHRNMVVKSAIECYNINMELSRNYGLNVRIGVNSGNMIVGDMGGGGTKLEYTAIGDNVNLASRLEGVNKFFETKILISENTYSKLSVELKDYFNYLGRISVKGKDIPIAIYYFLPAKKDIIDQFEKMVASYEKRDLKTFLNYVELFKNIDFGPAKFYVEYYENHKDNFGEPIKLTEK
ncbi:MAG TPA: adenylate/guanylate cyclase domain-containing protein [Spirochaetota bacterium]|mgnify:FL=1|nr:adenylate/guanylate cyclase domain-containing protein [Spirochaetota bacterium]HOL57860.1 adenylate/guanylate cyclase domain-containing protein [Spirochaetota bacterium]